MKLTRKQLNILIESLLHEAGPYRYMSSPEEIDQLEFERTGKMPSIEAVEEEIDEEKAEEAKMALTDIFFAAAGIGLAIFKAPFLLGVGVALVAGYITIPQAYERIVRKSIEDKEVFEQFPDDMSKLMGIDDEVLELLDDDLVEALPELYTNNVLTPSFKAGKNVKDVMTMSEYLDEYLRDISGDKLGLLVK